MKKYGNITIYKQNEQTFTLIWQAATWSLLSGIGGLLEGNILEPFGPSPGTNVSTWIRNGTPFSPPCFLAVNSVEMQLIYKIKTKFKNI